MTLTALTIFITLIVLISFPYIFNTLKLKNPNKIKIPSHGNQASLSKGKIFYRWHEPRELLSDEIIVLVHGFATPSLFGMEFWKICFQQAEEFYLMIILAEAILIVPKKNTV